MAKIIKNHKKEIAREMEKLNDDELKKVFGGGCTSYYQGSIPEAGAVAVA